MGSVQKLVAGQVESQESLISEILVAEVAGMELGLIVDSLDLGVQTPAEPAGVGIF